MPEPTIDGSTVTSVNGNLNVSFGTAVNQSGGAFHEASYNAEASASSQLAGDGADEGGLALEVVSRRLAYKAVP